MLWLSNGELAEVGFLWGGRVLAHKRFFKGFYTLTKSVRDPHYVGS